MGFATLIESRDQSTGGHIRRTTKYVELLAKETAKEKIYKEILTKDYIQNLIMAAPMHDIGKVTIPDAILQKAGKLTSEEYEIMKNGAEQDLDPFLVEIFLKNRKKIEIKTKRLSLHPISLYSQK